MITELDEPAQTVLSTAELVITTERVDDVALLLGHMIKMGLVEVLDHHLPQHWKQRGLSWGWTAVIWLAYIVTEGDHRKVSVEAYVKGMKQTLRQVTGQAVDPLDSSISDKIESIVFAERAPCPRSASTRQQSCRRPSVNSLHASSAR